MVAAAPNAGKSMFALIYAMKANVPTLFFSADTDTTTVMMRAASAASGHSQVSVESNLSNNKHYYDKHFGKLEHIKWVFDSSPSLDDIELEIRAYVELYGHAPELIVIDNLMNVMPPARRSIHGKVSQLPALILTLGYDPTNGELKVAAVKNRFGPHAADGKDYVTLFVNYAACQISDKNAWGVMLRNDVVNGYQGDYIVQQ